LEKESGSVKDWVMAMGLEMAKDWAWEKDCYLDLEMV
jgi:hypothetical protein